ncbi:MAG: cadherin-like beta sandwich domain-containing protein [Firmicutes bacterium]|nr:cadherin-like beta sandwich domain-containing protein [Bacillota bacterium]
MKNIKPLFYAAVLIAISLVVIVLPLTVFAADQVIVDHSGTNGEGGASTVTGEFLNPVEGTEWNPSNTLPGSNAHSFFYPGASVRSRFTNNTVSPVRWTPNSGLLDSGALYNVYYANINRYEIGGYTNDSESATITVCHNGEIETISYSQVNNPLGMVFIGQYVFAGDGSDYIQIINNSAGKILQAHSVMFIKLKENNANLSELSVSTNNISFSTDTITYNAGETTNDYICAQTQTEHPNATVNIEANGIEQSDPTRIGLSIGANIIDVTVTAADGVATKTYTINIERVVIINDEDSEGYAETGEWGKDSTFKGNNGSDSAFTTVKGSEAVFTPTLETEGAYEVHFFRVSANDGTDDTDIKIEVTRNGYTQELTFDGSGAGGWVSLGTFYFSNNGTENIKVTRVSDDGNNIVTRIDSVKLNKKDFTGNENTLDWLEVSGGSLNMPFSAQINQYTMIIPIVTNELEFTVYTLNPDTTIKINDVDVQYGKSEMFSLLGAESNINIQLTSPNGITGNYTILVRKSAYVTLDYNADGYQESGLWDTNTEHGGHDGTGTRAATGLEAATAEYKFDFNDSVPIRIQLYKVAAPNGDNNAKVEVVINGTQKTFYVDQTQGESGWLNLGIYDVTQGVSGYVRIVRQSGGDANSFTYADAVRCEVLTDITLEHVDLKNEEGQIIENLKPGNITVTASIKNYAKTDKPVSIIAILCKGTEQSYKVEKVAFSEEQTVLSDKRLDISFQCQIQGNAEDYIIKTYVIDSLKTFNMYDDAIIKK